MAEPTTPGEWLDLAVKHGSKEQLLAAAREQFSFLLQQGPIAGRLLSSAWKALSAEDAKIRGELMAWFKSNPEPKEYGPKYTRWSKEYAARRKRLDAAEKKTDQAWKTCEAYWDWSRKQREASANV